ncbi:unnamed protein product, partial [Effrenium voratum]
PELSAALGNPMAKPPRFGEPGFDESPAANWCWRYYADWQPRLFSEAWMGNSMTDVSDGHSIEIPQFTSSVYAGVIPKALQMLATLFGQAHVMEDSYCDDKEGDITKDNMKAVGAQNAASLLQGGGNTPNWMQDWSPSIRSDDPSLASLRQKLIKAYNNISHAPAQ